MNLLQNSVIFLALLLPVNLRRHNLHTVAYPRYFVDGKNKIYIFPSVSPFCLIFSLLPSFSYLLSSFLSLEFSSKAPSGLGSGVYCPGKYLKFNTQFGALWRRNCGSSVSNFANNFLSQPRRLPSFNTPLHRCYFPIVQGGQKQTAYNELH